MDSTSNPFSIGSDYVNSPLYTSNPIKVSTSSTASSTSKEGASGQSYYPIGTGYVTDASTEQKLATLEKTRGKDVADYVRKQLGLPVTPSKGNAASKTNNTVLDRYTKNLIQTLFAAELKVHKSISGGTSAVSGSIANATKTITGDIRGIKDSLHETLQPVSSFTGSTLGNLTGVLKNPLGAPEAIGKSIGHVIDKVNPGFTDRMEASSKQFKVDELAHLPSTILGGLRSLASTVDALLSVPLSIASDIYNGLMQIVKELSTLLDSVVAAVFDLIFGPKGLLDSLVPISSIMDFLSAVSQVAGYVGSIGGAFSGASMVTSMVSQAGSYASIGTGALSNPTSLAKSFLPPGATQFVSGLRNPQGLVNQLVPPQINQQLGKIGSLPGLGFVGNLGYGLGGSLENLQGGVVSKIAGQYSSQLGILGPLLGQVTGDQQGAYNMGNTSPAYISPASTNPLLPVVHGVRVYPSPKPLVIPSK